MDYCNIQANDMMWSLTSGELYQASWTHPEPRKIYSEDHLRRCPSRSPIDEIEGQHCHIVPQSGVDSDI